MLSIEEEVYILANYLTNSYPSENDVRLFKIAIKQYNLDVVNSKEANLWSLCLRNPWMFPYIDGGLSISSKDCIFRKRIYFLLNILEASPNNYNKFILSKKSKYEVIFFVMFFGLLGIFKSLLGLIIIMIFK